MCYALGAFGSRVIIRFLFYQALSGVFGFYSFELNGRKAFVLEFKTFNKKGKSENPKDESKNVFQFAFISIWVFISLLIPYVISYIKIPVMVNRYFISILPAVIILIALGFNQIKDNKIRNIIIALFIISSLTDIFIVKDYYNKITKTQFREITNDIILKNKSNSLIVSTWAWHLGKRYKA